MKKVYTLATAICLFGLSSCDDGKLTYNDIDFSTVTTVNRCSDQGDGAKVFYKLKETDAFILIADMDNFMRDESISVVDVEIDGTNTSLAYRKYNGRVENTSICTFPSPSVPTVVEEIQASPGATLRTQRMVSIRNNDLTELIGDHSVGLTYQYNFTILNVNFQDGETSIKYDRMPFGTNNYRSNTLAFKFLNNDNTLKTINACQTQWITLSDKEAMILQLAASDFPTEEGEKVIPLSDTRPLVYRQYARAGINFTEVCENEGDIPGNTPANNNRLVENWSATVGEIVINTRWTRPAGDEEPKLRHEITLKNVVFMKALYDNLTFHKTILPFGTFVQE
ncbi:MULTISPECIES: hypothetical protein [unclassified Myroides]|uniref:hypothetical protein n=1 Tax=unclassified Myroides TaxID=2642485 RepID=UPI0015FA1A4D|nr:MULTISPECIES: hypothetical protein [unclassified Myroides]MBB1150747.1 hypothetical protein [Myroides sp. NP-2]MDM1407580.1 hypothetical protein [Myroides sp. DF42-4-2]